MLSAAIRPDPDSGLRSSLLLEPLILVLDHFALSLNNGVHVVIVAIRKGRHL
jgi:hypothetical protein